MRTRCRSPVTGDWSGLVVEIGRELANEQQLDAVLGRAAELLCQTSADAACLLAVAGDGAIVAGRELSVEYLSAAVERFSAEALPPGPPRCLDVEDLASSLRSTLRRLGFGSFLEWPLRLHGRRLGEIQLAWFGPPDADLAPAGPLEALGALLAMAIERASTSRPGPERPARPRGENAWERTFDSIPELVMIIDTKHKVVRASDALARWLGADATTLRGRYCHEVVHGSRCPIDECPLEALLTDGKQHQKELESPRTNGRYVATVSPVFDRPGHVTACVHVLRDVTELRFVQGELSRSEELLHTVFENVPSGSSSPTSRAS